MFHEVTMRDLEMLAAVVLTLRSLGFILDEMIARIVKGPR